MDRVIVDTSAWIESFRPRGNEKIRNTVQRLLKDTIILMPGIIRVELLRGTKNKKEYKMLSELLSGLEYLPVNDSFWEKVARFSFDVFKAGITIPLTDTYIALLAMENQAALIHHDRHFDLVAKKFPLSIPGKEGVDP
ncbi:MAG: PIN domain nuclease [Pseudomonadota bacterium]|nr:PIN domain nuclease [Pseudomonadota bacterium]